MNLAPESSTPNHAAAALAGPKRATADAGPAAPKRTSAKAGFAMAALLVAIAVMGIMLSVALPTWSHMIRREKEEELIFRGNQYARAINLYGRRTTSPVVPSIDMLIEQRLLRKKYKDPLSPNKDGEFQLLYAQDQNAPGRASGPPPGITAWFAESASPRCGSPRCRDERVSVSEHQRLDHWRGEQEHRRIHSYLQREAALQRVAIHRG